MSRAVFRYEFPINVALEEVEATLNLTIMAVESLHGDTQVRLEVRHFLDEARRLCFVDATSEIGCDFNRIFAGFLIREFGADGFTVERVEQGQLVATR